MPWSNHLWNQNWHVLSITVWLVWLRHSSRCIFWLACRELWLCKSHQVVDSVFTYLAEPLQEHLRLGEAKNPKAFHYLSTIFPPGQNGLLSHPRSDNQDWKWKRHALSWAYLRELQNRIRLWAPSSNQSTRTLTASHTLSLSFSLVLGASKLDVMHTWLSRTQVWAIFVFFFARFQLSAERPSEKPRKAWDSRGLHSCYERNPTHKQKHGNIIKLNDKNNFSLLRSIPIVQQYLYATLQSFDHITKSLQLQKVQKASEGMT